MNSIDVKICKDLPQDVPSDLENILSRQTPTSCIQCHPISSTIWDMSEIITEISVRETAWLHCDGISMNKPCGTWKECDSFQDQRFLLDEGKCVFEGRRWVQLWLFIEWLLNVLWRFWWIFGLLEVLRWFF